VNAVEEDFSQQIAVRSMGTSEQYCPPQPPMIESTLALNPNASSNAFNTTTTSAEYPAKVDFYLAEIYPLVREIYDEMTWNVFPGIIRRGMNALAFAEHGYNSSGFEKVLIPLCFFTTAACVSY
jgi:hypothetical protein